VARTDRILLGATIAVLAVIAVFLGVIGAFYSPYDVHVVGIPLPLGVMIAVVGNLALGFGGTWATGTRVTPGVTALAWFVVAFLLGTTRPEGDLVVPGSGWHGIAFLFLGVGAAAVAIGLGPKGGRAPKLWPSLRAETRR
jgi:hypothetical protein